MNGLYAFLLTIHGALALAVLVLIPVVIMLFIGRKAAVGRVSAIAIPLLHLQFLIGLYLYFFGGNGVKLFQADDVMKEASLRFYAVEHITTMVLAVILLSIGRVQLKKQLAARQSLSKKPLVFFIIGFVFLLARVPWERWPFVGQ